MAPSDKIVKAKGVAATELEEEIARMVCDIENAPGSDLKADLKEFQFCSAKEIECASAKQTKSAVVVFIPYRVWRETKRITGRLIRELEKKLQRKHVVIVANRTIMDKNYRRKDPNQTVRPRNRTLTAVHEAILEDVCTPTEIVGKRTRVNADGSKIQKIFLDKKDREAVEDKLAAFSTIYRTLTTREAVFDFM